MKEFSHEVKTAWLLWNLLDDLSRILWILYEEEFTEMIEQGERVRSLSLLLSETMERNRNF